MSTTTRHPAYSRKLREEALAAYRDEGSYRKAGARMNLSPKRVRELVKDALALELAEARANEEGSTDG